MMITHFVSATFLTDFGAWISPLLVDWRLMGWRWETRLCHSDSPPGSTAAHPLWFLRSSWFRLGRVPSGRSECWHACWAFRRTSPPVARPRQTLCLHWLLTPAEKTERERERKVGVNAIIHYRAHKNWGVLSLTDLRHCPPCSLFS